MMLLAVFVGAVAMAVLSPIPVAGPIIAGFIAGVIVGGVGRGLLAGFLSGTIDGILAGLLLTSLGGSARRNARRQPRSRHRWSAGRCCRRGRFRVNAVFRLSGPSRRSLRRTYPSTQKIAASAASPLCRRTRDSQPIAERCQCAARQDGRTGGTDARPEQAVAQSQNPARVRGTSTTGCLH